MMLVERTGSRWKAFQDVDLWLSQDVNFFDAPEAKPLLGSLRWARVWPKGVAERDVVAASALLTEMAELDNAIFALKAAGSPCGEKQVELKSREAHYEGSFGVAAPQPRELFTKAQTQDAIILQALSSRERYWVTTLMEDVFRPALLEMASPEAGAPQRIVVCSSSGFDAGYLSEEWEGYTQYKFSLHVVFPELLACRGDGRFRECCLRHARANGLADMDLATILDPPGDSLRAIFCDKPSKAQGLAAQGRVLKPYGEYVVSVEGQLQLRKTFSMPSVDAAAWADEAFNRAFAAEFEELRYWQSLCSVRLDAP